MSVTHRKVASGSCKHTASFEHFDGKLQTVLVEMLDLAIEIKSTVLRRISVETHFGHFFEQDIAVAYPIFKTALALANQTKTAPAGSERSRRISREVRQRVWQQYGGRCADCGAKDYLEFDHVIPFSKGGSNSDANIQLLCRRCNLSKSDRI